MRFLTQPARVKCHFHGSKKFEILPFSSDSLTPSIFSLLNEGPFRLFRHFY
ncbi:hypothetical protein Hanom_Chr09g00853961 [Helianthus anomalus]